MSLVGLDSRRLQATTNTKAKVKIFLESSDATERVVEDLVTAASSASFSASVGAGLNIIDVLYVAFGDLMKNSSLATLTVTSLGHVTEVLSPASDAGTLFCAVNTMDASASSDTATGLEMDGEAAPATYALDSSRVLGNWGACLGPRCDHNNLRRARLLSASSVGLLRWYL